MATQITTISAGNILIETGHGAPTHIAPKGSQFTDIDTANLYFNKDGLTNWQLNVDNTNSGGTIYTTGFTYNNNTLTIKQTLGQPDLSVLVNTMTGLTVNGDLTVSAATNLTGGLSANTISATTYFNLPTDIRVTGGTYSAGTITMTNNTGGTFSVTGFSTSTATAFTGGTVTGATNFTGGLTANTISATTYYNLPVTTDVTVTGSTYSDNTFTYTNNTGGTFNVLFNTVTGLTVNGTISATTYLNLPIDVKVTGSTYSDNTFTYTNNTGGTFNVLFNTLTGLTVTGSISATTISGGTLYGDGSNLTGIIPPLSQGQIFIGDNTNSAAARNVVGDININYTGNTTIQPSVVTYAKIQNVSQQAVLGSSSVTGGTVEEIPMIEAYINSSGTTATLLTNTSNWDINGVYIGTVISGTTQGQSHYNVDYWFTAIDDNSWIRMIRG